jgi:hypothetical protein
MAPTSVFSMDTFDGGFMSERIKKAQNEANQVLAAFGDHFTSADVTRQKDDSADLEVTIQKATGHDYQFTWVSLANKEQMQRQLGLFMLSSILNDLPSGPYDGRDYLPD